MTKLKIKDYHIFKNNSNKKECNHCKKLMRLNNSVKGAGKYKKLLVRDT